MLRRFHMHVSEVMENRTDGQKGEDMISHVAPVTCQQRQAPAQEMQKSTGRPPQDYLKFKLETDGGGRAAVASVNTAGLICGRLKVFQLQS